MRIIGTIQDERKAIAFSKFLQQNGIPHQIEIDADNDWGSPSYGTKHCHVWIHHEEDVGQVLKWFDLFQENPENPLFLSPSLSPIANLTEAPVNKSQGNSNSKSPSQSSWEREPMGWITKGLLAICCILFMLSQVWVPSLKIPEKYAGLILFSSPIEKALLFDYPKFYQLLDHFVLKYGYEDLDHPSDLPPAGEHLLEELNKTSVWPGIYQLILKEGWLGAINGFKEYPTFEKIREGQIWRLFSPCLLHADLFHLFFNMIWLIVLSKQIELRITPGRYIFFIILIGIVSNISQYIMSGANFIGFSGILCGMLAFIWMRQKHAAWEGYQIDRMTLIFMLIYIVSLASIQLLSFFMEKSFQIAFSPNIANMAHLTGGLMGFLLGRFNFFSWRHT